MMFMMLVQVLHSIWAAMRLSTYELYCQLYLPEMHGGPLFLN